MERRLAAILAADVVGYSRLMGQDEAGTLQALKVLRTEVVDPAIAEHRGRIFKLAGDGLLAEFSSVVNAVACAVEIQQGMLKRNARYPIEQSIQLRIGVNLGDVIVESDDIFGDGVNVAARLEGIAPPCGVVISGTVRDHLGSRLDLRFEDIGEQNLKNIAQPVRAWSIVLVPDSRQKAKESEKPRRGIAVLPFDNMSGDPEQEYFADGITEDIITDLSKISGLQVIARNTVFTYKNKPKRVQQTALELDVNYILEGSVRKAGSRVRVTGQLIDGRNGNHLWAERYDRELTDIFAIQDELTRAIVEQLKITLLPSEVKSLNAIPTDNVEAYNYFLRGRQLLHMWSKPKVILARQMFAQAIQLDPNYARAYAGIADCDSMLQFWLPANSLVQSILEMSAKALALDARLADAHASRAVALQFSGQTGEAIAEFERALELEPDLYEANYYYARFCFAQRDYGRASKLFDRACQLRPEDYHAPALLQMAYQAMGMKREANEAAREVVKRAERELELRPENSGAAGLGAISLARLGEVTRAKDWARRAQMLEPDDPPLLYNVACVYSQIGELELALDILEKLIPNRGPEQIKWFMNDPDLHAIRDHPRYAKLIMSPD